MALVDAANPSVAIPLTATEDVDAGWPSFVLTLDEPLVAGTSYVLLDGNACDSPNSKPPIAMFQTGPATPVPTELGVLTASEPTLGPFEVWTSSGTCTTMIEAAQVTLTLELATAVLPWRDMLRIQTLVDGVVWVDGTPFRWLVPRPNGVWPRTETVFRLCRTDDPSATAGIDGGMHEVAMRAMLPGTSLVLTTPPVTVQLECPPDPVEPDPAPPIEPRGSTTTSSSSWAALFALLRLRRRRR